MGLGLLLALGVPATAVAPCLLAATLLAVLVAGGKLVQRTLVVARVRGEQQAAAAEARFGAGISRAHDWIRVEGDLRALLDTELDDRVRAEITRSLGAIEGLRDAMRSTRVARDRHGRRVPAVAGHAEVVAERIGGSLKPYSGTPQQLVPSRLRGAGTQLSMVLDEVRVLHNAEIERSVLIFTLLARAALVVMAPLLGAWTQAETPLIDTGTLADLVWLAAAAVSVLTLAMAPGIVDTVMRDDEDASRFRHRLLVVEVPMCLLAMPLLPAWTVVVFAVGWTNWWQRQTPRLEFDWAKLGVFVGAVVALQCLGLAVQRVPADNIALEVAITLTAIAVIGGSYGAMLPLALATMVAVIVGDGSRSIRTARRARGSLLDCARQLRSTASLIDATGPEMPLARNAATLSRQAAGKLEREADLFGRRGLLAPQVVAELFDQAIAASSLNRADAVQLDLERQAAADLGEGEPAFALEPILGEFAEARLTRQHHARVLRAILVTAYNEARVHGTKGVRASLEQPSEKLRLRVGNLARPRSLGTSGEGGSRIASLTAKLPGGALTEPPRLRSAVELGYPGNADWWVVEITFSPSILAHTVKYSD
ncbi:MAG: hypothetical protein ACOYD4_09880 [Solirubrobacterales bacterium]